MGSSVNGMVGMVAIESRRKVCDECGCAGVHTDTLDGDIVLRGEVVATVSEADETILMCGNSDGSSLHLLLCQDCAE